MQPGARARRLRALLWGRPPLERHCRSLLTSWVVTPDTCQGVQVSEGRIAQDDLDWWFGVAASRQWTFARTYATTAPHHYIVEGRTPGVTHEDIVRAARVIVTFGRPGKYYSVTKIYLESPDGQYRWWTEDSHFTDATLVNRGTTSALHGIQNAPSTSTGAPSPYDEVATIWDELHGLDDEAKTRIAGQLRAVRGTYPPHALDIGCGIGRVLDLGLVSADRYAAVDSSTAMLNVLVRKHPQVAAVYPMDIREALLRDVFRRGQFDWVFLDDDVDLDTHQRSQIERMARRALIVVGRRSWEVQRQGMPEA